MIIVRSFARIALLLSIAASACAAEPVRQDLYVAGEGGYAMYRIPGLVVTAKGSLLAYCELRKTGSDWAQIDVMLRRSADGGKTWDAMRKISELPKDAKRNEAAAAKRAGKEGEITVNNPVLIAGRDGGVHLLYCVEYARCFYARSDDDGLTFGPPTEITAAFDAFRPEYAWKVLAAGPGHGIQLSAAATTPGRLIVPVWLSTATGGNAHHPSCVATIYSDDDGKTWRRGAIVADNPQVKDPNETVAVELADGSVMLNIRHENKERVRGVSVSPDGISKWSPVRFDAALPDPICFGTIARLSKAGPDGKGTNRLLFANPHNPTDRKRQNLTIKLSEDEGKTWPTSKVLEPGFAAYSDLAVGPDGTIHCLFESGGKVGKNYGALTLATFDVGWLTAE